MKIVLIAVMVIVVLSFVLITWALAHTAGSSDIKMKEIMENSESEDNT